MPKGEKMPTRRKYMKLNFYSQRDMAMSGGVPWQQKHRERGMICGMHVRIITCQVSSSGGDK